MKLKEVCGQTGLTKKTIRFYEETGLLFPRKTYKNGREYRDYDEADVRRLLDIAILRRARFTIQEIKRMEARPEELGPVFDQYRKGLYAQRQELESLISAADQVRPEALTSVAQLIGLLEHAATALPLPAMDIRPRFRYLDEQEDAYAEFRRRKTALRQKRRSEDMELALHTSVSQAACRRGCARELGPGNEQKFAILQMLREKD